MKTQLLYQFYALLGLHSPAEVEGKANQIRGAWRQDDKKTVQYLFSKVRTISSSLKHYPYEHLLWISDSVAFRKPQEKYNRELGCWLRYKDKSVTVGEILQFFKENERYRKRYWSPEARMQRIIQSGDDGQETKA